MKQRIARVHLRQLILVGLRTTSGVEYKCPVLLDRALRRAKDAAYRYTCSVVCLQQGADCLHMAQLVPLHTKTP